MKPRIKWVFLLLILSMLLPFNHVLAQDTLNFKNGQRLAGITVVKLNNSKVKVLRKANGETEYINFDLNRLESIDMTYSHISLADYKVKKRKNIDKITTAGYKFGIAINTFDLLYNYYTIEPEYYTGSGYLVISAPISFPAKPVKTDFVYISNLDRHKYFPGLQDLGVGLKLKYFRHGQGSFRYYHSFMMEYGTYTSNLYKYDPNNNYSIVSFDKPGNYLGCFYQLGAQKSFFTNFYINADIGLGYVKTAGWWMKSMYEYASGTETSFKLRMGINLGVRI